MLNALRNPGWVAFVWFGMTAGISLLEAPVKFTAPSLTREVALDVGRVVFAMVEQGILIKQDGDQPEDFADVFDFEEAFEANYPWEARP